MMSAFALTAGPILCLWGRVSESFVIKDIDSLLSQDLAIANFIISILFLIPWSIVMINGLIIC